MKGDGSKTRTLDTELVPAESGNRTLAPLQLDYEKYRGHVTEPDVSDEQAQALMQEVWKLMTIMVDIGFGEDATHIVLSSFAKALTTEFEVSARGEGVTRQDGTADPKQTQRKT